MRLEALEPHAWKAIDKAMAAKVGFVARLLAGEVPTDLEDVFRDAGLALFPDAWRDLRSDCSCPDWENPCKHIAAVLYVFADQLDADPWLVLAWRGRTRDQVLDPLRASRTRSTVEEVAPWWPFAPGARPAPGDGGGAGAGPPAPPDRPDAVLDALAPLEVQVGGVPFVELIRPAYERIVTTASEPGD
jgi:hypothetical protein